MDYPMIKEDHYGRKPLRRGPCLRANTPDGPRSLADQAVLVSGLRCLVLDGVRSETASAVWKALASDLAASGTGGLLLPSPDRAGRWDGLLTEGWLLLAGTVPLGPSAWTAASHTGRPPVLHSAEALRAAVPLRQIANEARRQGRAYLSVAAAAAAICRAAVNRAADHRKIQRLAERLVRRDLRTATNGGGRVWEGYFTAIGGDASPLGSCRQAGRSPGWRTHTVPFSGELLTLLADAGAQLGLTVVRCRCPLFPDGEPEHLFFPEAGVVYLTANGFHLPEQEPVRVVNARRFTAPEEMRRPQGPAAGEQAAAASSAGRSGPLPAGGRRCRRCAGAGCCCPPLRKHPRRQPGGCASSQGCKRRPDCGT